MLRKTLIVSACAGLAGGWIGWSSIEKESLPPPVKLTIDGPLRPGPRPVWTTADFLQSARDLDSRMKQPGFNPLAEKVADWTDQEIIAALNASLTDPECILFGGAGEGLVTQLFGEWMRRDLAAAIAWFDRLEPPGVKTRFIWPIMSNWPAEENEKGLAFILTNKNILPLADGGPILTRAFEERAEKGAAAVIDLLKTSRERNIQIATGYLIQFPYGFDFPALMGSPEFQILWEEKKASLFLHGWFAKDWDAAFEWMLEKNGAASLSEIHLWGADEKWLGAKFEALDAGQRGEVLEAKTRQWINHPDALVTFAQGIQDPVILEEACQAAIQIFYSGKTHQVMPVIESIADPARRIEILENAPAKTPNGRARSEFSAIDESLLRKKLAEWQATDAQVESIIFRFKP